MSNLLQTEASTAECACSLQAAIDVFSAFLTPVIAVIAVCIAYQQAKTNRRRLELNLYEGRLRVYQAVIHFLDEVLTELSPAPQDIFDLRKDTAEADFLFESDVREYIQELIACAAKLRRGKREYGDHQKAPPEGYDHDKVVEALLQEEEWFFEQRQAALELFAKYLKLAPEPRRFRWRPKKAN